MPDQTPEPDETRTPTYGELMDKWIDSSEKANDYLIRLGRVEERLTEVERERDTAAAQLAAANRAVEHLSSRAGDRQDAQADTGTDARFVRALSLIHHLMRSRRRYQGSADYWHTYAGNMEQQADRIVKAWRATRDERDAARARIAELEAASPAPAGYVVVTRNSEGGVHRSATVWESLDQARAAEDVQAGYADGTGCTAAVYELREVRGDA